MEHDNCLVQGCLVQLVVHKDGQPSQKGYGSMETLVQLQIHTTIKLLLSLLTDDQLFKLTWIAETLRETCQNDNGVYPYHTGLMINLITVTLIVHTRKTGLSLTSSFYY